MNATSNAHRDDRDATDPHAVDLADDKQAWATYVRRVTKGSKQSVVAKRTGLDQATISRWLGHGRPGRPAQVAQFARAYPEETTVLDAFVAAGFLRSGELGHT